MNAPSRVLIAPDKFKGTLSSPEAAHAIRAGLSSVWPDASFTTVALADGGEGFTECLVTARGGRMRSAVTVDALNRKCTAQWGELDSDIAVLEIASASGLATLPNDKRDPLTTSTFGTGLVLRDILKTKPREVLIGLGGSATNDGGMGIASALGFRFLDRHGADLEPCGRSLSEVGRIENPLESIATRIVIATDVSNHLCGPFGAAEQFARQKGANEDDVRRLDDGLRHFAEVVTAHIGRDLSNMAGAGAAGGAGFGLMSLLNAQRCSGFEVLSQYLQLPALIDAHELIVTGEGSIDRTSLSGKAAAQLALLARQRNRVVWGVFGRCEDADAAALFHRYAAIDADDLDVSRAEHAQRLARCAAHLAQLHAK